MWDVLDSSVHSSSVEVLAEDMNDDIIDKKAIGIDEEVWRRMMPEYSLPALAAEQAEADIELLLGVLSPGERVAVRLACGYEGSFDTLGEAAEAAGAKVGTVDVQYRRALKKLRSRSPDFLGKIAERLGVQILPPDKTDTPPTP